MSKTTATVVATDSLREFKISRPAVRASDEELSEMRKQKYLSSLRKTFGGRTKRFRVSGQPREII